MSGLVRIGTSGWHYPHWVGPFYPRGMPPGAFLAHYARQFDTVEVNNTFYGLPGPEAVAAWCRDTPPGFLFACKSSRYITHMKKLKDPEAATARFFEAVAALKPSLGPILFQLPPRWRCDPDRLAAFLDALPEGYRYAFEFRDQSWWCRPVYDLLERAGAALCIFDLAGQRSPVERTAGFVYIRLHGPAGAYQGSYDGRSLAGWARRIAAWRADGANVYCYFDNDEAGYAPQDAARLAEMIG